MVQLVSRTVVIQKEKFHYKFFKQETCSSLIQLQSYSHLEKTTVQLAHSNYNILKFFSRQMFFLPSNLFPCHGPESQAEMAAPRGPKPCSTGQGPTFGNRWESFFCLGTSGLWLLRRISETPRNSGLTPGSSISKLPAIDLQWGVRQPCKP